MSVGAISSLTSLSSSGTTSTSTAASATSALSLDFTTFLKILTTQLQNQDPTNATDPNQFTQELIAMEQVQTQISTNDQLETLSSVTAANGLATGVGYIGNYVRAETSEGEFSLQGSTAEVGYTLDSAASSATITITDSSGKVVTTLAGAGSSGDNYVTWDGKDSSGNAVADGAYTFSVAAKDSSGNTVDVSNLTALYKVTAVHSNDDGTLTLEAGDLALLSSDVTGVYSSASLPSATAGTTLTTG